MSYRRWSDEEIEYLTKNYGRYSIQAIADKLDRTNLGVIQKANRLGLGLAYEAQGTITAAELARALGRRTSVILRWIYKNGLKSKLKTVKEKRKYQMIRVTDFWAFAKEHPMLMKWELYERNTLPPEPEWLDEEIKNYFETRNKNKDKVWTKAEDCYLLTYYNKGKLVKDIAEFLGRSEMSTWCRLKKLKVPKRVIQIPWKPVEDEILINMRGQGKIFKDIAEELGRSIRSVQRRYDRIKKGVQG